MSPNDPVERGNPLLTVQQQLDDPGSRIIVPPMSRLVRLRGPHKQTPHRMPLVQGGHQSPNLIPIPDVAPLKFRKGNETGVDLVKDGCNFQKVAPS